MCGTVSKLEIYYNLDILYHKHCTGYLAACSMKALVPLRMQIICLHEIVRTTTISGVEKQFKKSFSFFRLD